MLRSLKRLYRPPKSFLHWRTPLQLLIATILSARCTDAQVNKVTPALFKKYRSVEDFAFVSQSELERYIHSCGTFRMKAKHIRTLSRLLIERHQGNVPDTMEELIELPGVGRKTAAIILYAAFGKQEGIAVDTHVGRIAQRLGLTKHRTPEKIELDLMRVTPRETWGVLNTLMISFGRDICMSRNRKCEVCPFRKECPSSKVMGRGDRAGIDVASAFEPMGRARKAKRERR